MASKVIAYRKCQDDRGNGDEQRGFYSSHRIDLWDQVCKEAGHVLRKQNHRQEYHRGK
jgi:hypothetical protein